MREQEQSFPQLVPPRAQGRAPETAMTADNASYAKTLDELWARRDQAESRERAEATLAEGLRASPSEVGLLWRAARLHFWQAEISDDANAKQAQAKRGWEEAERALALEPECSDARYWAAAACGTYAEALGVLAALAQGIEAKFRKNLDWAVERAPGYERGGPQAILGRYFAQLPWPKRDRKKALANLRAALAGHPENLRTKLYLAEVLQGDSGAPRREALELLDQILSAPPSSYDEPEARLIQSRARALRPRIAKELS